MKYPMINNWLKFKRISKMEVQVKDLLCDDEYTMGYDIARFARRLNGKRDPYSIYPDIPREDIDYMLEQLGEHELLRDSNVLMSERGSVFYTLWIPKQNKLLFRFAKVYSFLLNLLWLPIFALGIWFFFQEFPTGGEVFAVVGSLGGIVVGAFLHELGHMFTGIRYKAHVFEMGVMIQHFMPGAYVLLDSDKVKSKKCRVAINAAGIKSNVLFAGVCMLLACVFPFSGMPLLCAAVNNVLLALINLVFIEGLDGSSIIEEYLGVPNVAKTAKKLLFSKKSRKALMAKGATGYAIMAVGITIQFLQLALPLLIGINILEVLSCFA